MCVLLILLRLWKFANHHSGSPEISYSDKYVFQVRFPHRCITGLVRVPGCASLSYPLFFFYLLFETNNIPSTTNSTTTPPPPQRQQLYNHAIPTTMPTTLQPRHPHHSAINIATPSRPPERQRQNAVDTNSRRDRKNYIPTSVCKISRSRMISINGSKRALTLCLFVYSCSDMSFFTSRK